MAVTIPATGSGTATPQVATDVITSVHYQIMKVYDATAGSTNALIVTAAGAAKVDGSAVTQPVSGTVTANLGTLNGAALDASVTALQVTQGSTTSGQKGSLMQGAVTTAAPTYTTAQTSPLSLTTAGALRSDLTTIAGTTVDVNSGTKSAGTQRVVLATDQPALTNALKVDPSAVTSPISAASLPLPTGASTAAKQPALGTAGTPSADVLTVQGAASMTALKVDPSGVTSPVSIAATVKTTQTPTTSGGYSVSRLLSAATTNATSVKASAGQVYGFYLFNSAAYTVFLKLYNKASAPTVGTDTPFMTIPVPAGGGAVADWDSGIALGTGIAFAITKLVADADTTAVAANDLVVNLLYV